MPTPTVLDPEIYVADIRVALGFDPDAESELPQALIDQKVPTAEAKIKRRVEGYASLSGDDLVFLRTAAVAATAAALCEPIKQRMPAREKSPFFEYSSSVSWDKKKAELEAEVEVNLSLISTYTPATLNLFALAGPQR